MHRMQARSRPAFDTTDPGLTPDRVAEGAGGADETGHGLSGLADRVEALGGSLELTSPPGGGTCVRATIPT